MHRFLLLVGTPLLSLALLAGCAAFQLAGALGQAYEEQKQIEVLAEYDGLEGKRVAVVVDADMNLRYQNPDLVQQVAAGVALRIQRDVSDAQVINPAAVLDWQWRTPQWNAMPYGKIAEVLNAERVVFVDIYEYRLHPPGNRWIWEGVCAASVSVIESDAIDPDMFVDTFNVISEFPNMDNVDRNAADAQQIERGLLSEFVKQTTWLFHTHLEPKYPDRYRPELNTAS
jgi:hypothetical protein